jgi:hypothetical protein
MWRRPVTVIGALCLCLAAGGETPISDALLLRQVRLRAIANLNRLPDYTCMQTIERRVRRPQSRKFELQDVVRLEVALVSGKELFAWPGAKKFDDRPISDLVTGGAIGNGSFALHLKTIFETKAPTFTFEGEENRDGRRTYHWKFEVPQHKSGYLLRAGGREAIVGYHGSFYVDANTLDLIQLEVEAENIPPELKVMRARDSVEYSRETIGGETFLLPAASELQMMDQWNSESVNRTRFSSCHQYQGESVISFGDPAAAAKEMSKPAQVIELPAGLILEADLETPISSESAAVGDPVTAVVHRPSKQHGVVMIPKGALLRGRITLLRRQNAVRPSYVLGMDFDEVEFPGAVAKVHTVLDQIVSVNGSITMPGANRFGTRAQYPELDPALGSVVFVKGDSFKLARGLGMIWRTAPEPAAEEKTKQ